jgi:hypothetical protein
MRCWGLTAIVALTLAQGASAQAPASPSRAAAAFARLAALAGTWSGIWANGRPHSVTYRLSAGGTVLVETWALGPGRESITIYHLDGERLLATHYCPQGTQPRLALALGSDPGRLDFTLLDGANLDAPGRSHQDRFTVWLQGPDRYERSEHYVENGVMHSGTGAAPDERVAYSRVAER